MGCKNLLKFTYLTMKFHNRHHTSVYLFCLYVCCELHFSVTSWYILQRPQHFASRARTSTWSVFFLVNPKINTLCGRPRLDPNLFWMVSTKHETVQLSRVNEARLSFSQSLRWAQKIIIFTLLHWMNAFFSTFWH